VIPSKSNAKTPILHDPNIYAMRNIVERFFCALSLIVPITCRAMNEGHAQTGNPLREAQPEFPCHAAFICH
jgi:hypothetical protein